MMQISFYVLSESKAQDFLGFICQLTQTALNKSSQSLLILAENEALLSDFDEALWVQDASSFIPHQRLIANENTVDNIGSSIAPVLLGAYLPAEFNGIVINTTSRPVNDFITATSNTQPARVLEIIKPDDASVQDGRVKYKRYQQLGYELTHFKV
ncbi:DNA polymerase III subunit chi [Psychrobacter sp. 72-O-c]|uniref:DNA polymerase III subunit chi n=1 Tax=Psychrobacter sp. 72-O-c TaxID=2774125 RepID=UPI001D11F660|nr:DNA polymerase III subunit chi [Psychrobacter sp. 72-O-c]